MIRLLAIADDLSGAAEIAGAALRLGLPARLAEIAPDSLDPGATVLNTDSRSLTPCDAATAVAAALAPLQRAADSAAGPDFVYKKTDSVLRGPISAELRVIQTIFHKPRVLLVPQNPSRGRTIRSGHYFINEIPLHRTTFANDPLHPAHSSHAETLLGDTAGSIHIPDAESESDLLAHAQSLDATLLPAGGVDFFIACLRSLGFSAGSAANPPKLATPALFVNGSASAYSRELLVLAQQHHIPVVRMPQELFDNPDDTAALLAWVIEAATALTDHRRAVLSIGRESDHRLGVAERLQSRLAAAVREICSRIAIQQLLVDGGATASAVCQSLHLGPLAVVAELAPGVVQTAAGTGLHLAIKPGSYAWPASVWADLAAS